MAARKSNISVLCVVGPTASGKSKLALNLAEVLNGEIISVDSRTVYAGMDIGTAKPSAAEMAFIPHHGIDLVLPDVKITAAKIKKLAEEKIADIKARGKLPVLVGGSGLYMDAVLFDYGLGAPGEAGREALAGLDLPALQRHAAELGLEVPAQTWQNPRHLAGFIARGGQPASRRPEPAGGVLIVGLRPPRETLLNNISHRAEHMLASGLEAEVRRLAAEYGWEAPGLSAIGYREFKPYLEQPGSEKELSSGDREAVRQAIITDTVRYAKRQMTWFKRNPFVQWFGSPEQAYDFVVQSFNEAAS